MNDDTSSLGRRIGRVAHVVTTLSGAAIKTLGAKITGNSDAFPQVLTEALGKLKGPIMKVGQILAMVPGMLPDDVAESLMQLQSQAPSMGWPFVRRRMAFELGAEWQTKFTHFEKEASAAASLGQVHKAQLSSGETVACKLQYPNMLSSIEGDLDQLRLLLGLYERTVPILDTVNIQHELKERLKEELDYRLELRNMERFRKLFGNTNLPVIVPKSFESYSTDRLLTMEWCDGADLMAVKNWSITLKRRVAENLFQAWYYPLYQHGVLHGDPHFGNYRITPEGQIIMLDFGCVREFPESFLAGVRKLYRALELNSASEAHEAYEMWGFENLTSELVDALNIWAKFLYGPLLDDRIRPLVESPQEGKDAAKAVIQALKKSGKVRPPKEFVFMDRAAVGIGSAMIHLGVELNWHQLFQSLVESKK
ncbi:MAG: AarF/ABC1/UbiB kinase family protein [Alphaproteobacteria bacterium]|nr:AarF/ABC1/UbiB kinase family protein [Alphaproteobacteria bacterium]